MRNIGNMEHKTRTLLEVLGREFPSNIAFEKSLFLIVKSNLSLDEILKEIIDKALMMREVSEERYEKAKGILHSIRTNNKIKYATSQDTSNKQKICKQCHTEKTLDKFRKVRENAQGEKKRDSTCGKCRSANEKRSRRMRGVSL